MKVEVRRGIEKGHPYVWVSLGGGEPIYTLHLVSRELTGTTGEWKSGIFEDVGDTFSYGDFRREFEFPEELNLREQDAATIIRILRDRVAQVREWVRTVDRAESIEFEL